MLKISQFWIKNSKRLRTPVRKFISTSSHLRNQVETPTCKDKEKDNKLHLFKEKIAIVTGGASGIGLECARALLWRGCAGVAIADVNVQKGEDALKIIANEFGNDKAVFIKCDVTKSELVDWAFKNTIRAFDSLDIVVNSAAVINDASWENEVATNITGCLVGSLLGLQYMNKTCNGRGGIIVNLASIMGLKPKFGCPIFCMTQAGIIGLTRALSEGNHVERTGVKIMGVCTGPTDTPMYKNIISENSPDDRFTTVLKEELKSKTLQCPCLVGCAVLSAIEKNESGAIWVIENDEQPYRITFPCHEDLKIKGSCEKQQSSPCSKDDKDKKNNESCEIKKEEGGKQQSSPCSKDERKKNKESQGKCPAVTKTNGSKSLICNKPETSVKTCDKRQTESGKGSGKNEGKRKSKVGSCIDGETCPKLTLPKCPGYDTNKQKQKGNAKDKKSNKDEGSVCSGITDTKKAKEGDKNPDSECKIKNKKIASGKAIDKKGEKASVSKTKKGVGPCPEIIDSGKKVKDKSNKSKKDVICAKMASKSIDKEEKGAKKSICPSIIDKASNQKSDKKKESKASGTQNKESICAGISGKAATNSKETDKIPEGKASDSKSKESVCAVLNDKSSTIDKVATESEKACKIKDKKTGEAKSACPEIKEKASTASEKENKPSPEIADSKNKTTKYSDKKSKEVQVKTDIEGLCSNLFKNQDDNSNKQTADKNKATCSDLNKEKEVAKKSGVSKEGKEPKRIDKSKEPIVMKSTCPPYTIRQKLPKDPKKFDKKKGSNQKSDKSGDCAKPDPVCKTRSSPDPVCKTKSSPGKNKCPQSIPPVNEKKRDTGGSGKSRCSERCHKSVSNEDGDGSEISNTKLTSCGNKKNSPLLIKSSSKV